MKFMKKFLQILITTFLLGKLVFSASSFAQESADIAEQFEGVDSSTQSMSISPAILELILEPGKNSTSEILLVNNARVPLPIKGTVQNFTLNESFIGSSEVVSENIYDASSWFDLEPSEFIIQPGEEKSITVSVATPENAEPGGHYATIFFQPLIPEGMVSKSSTQLTTKVGVLVLSIVSGDIQERATLGKLTGPSFYRMGPITFQIPVNNEGNIHVLPAGQLFIKNSKGELVQSLLLQPSSVLPKTQKNFDFVWDKKLLLGKYTAIAEVKYGSGNVELISNAYTFWVFPWLRVFVIICMLTGAILFIRLTYRNFSKALNVLLGRE